MTVTKVLRILEISNLSTVPRISKHNFIPLVAFAVEKWTNSGKNLDLKRRDGGEKDGETRMEEGGEQKVRSCCG